MKKFIKIQILLLVWFAVQNIFSQPVLIDNFESINDWKIYKSDAVDVDLTSKPGLSGNCIALNYNFISGAGYGGMQKLFSKVLPENFEFSFWLKAESPNNNFEFKLIDSTGQNVWWVNSRSYDFPNNWKKITFKKRDIYFAWGPINDKELRKIDRIEFTIASAVGGKGTVFIDSLTFKQLPPEGGILPVPVITASSILDNNLYPVSNVSDGNTNTAWKSDKSANQEIIYDFITSRELGGVTILWETGLNAADFELLSSDDGKTYETVFKAGNAQTSKSFIMLKEYSTRFIKLSMTKSASTKGYGIKEIRIENIGFSSSTNRFFINVAKEYPKGFFPRYLNEEGTFWTITGVNEDTKESLINEDGMIEPDEGGYSIEPFISMNGKFLSYRDVTITNKLEDDYLPVPSVIWEKDGLTLQTKMFSSGKSNINSVLFADYTIKNNSKTFISGKLFLTLRPFQVNPYYQDLNRYGGFAKINSLAYQNSKVLINGNKQLITMGDETSFGASSFNTGLITDFISKGIMPTEINVRDNMGFASGVLSYDYSLKPGESKKILIAVPYYSEVPIELLTGNYESKQKYFSEQHSTTTKFWKEITNKVKFNLPESASPIINSIRSNIAYVLINRDNYGIQPGSRTYERSWIRDGSLTSSALLKFGIQNEVKQFAEWYSKFQYENGKIPCVVDKRGADPTAENDSHGQFIYLIKQYFKFSKDTVFLAGQYGKVKKTVEYISSLIAQRTTDHYLNGSDSIKSLYGLIPESISHEGYSDSPMHSYWDDFFALKGLNDAIDMANVLNKESDEISFIKLRDKFQKDLFNSISLTIKRTGIDYIPGCAEKGDFDATSTTTAITPCGQSKNFPVPYLKNTFIRYKKFFEKREDVETKWENYTPYEVRTIGSFVLLDMPEFAHHEVEFFLNNQFPKGWNHWAEVVWKYNRTPRMIGDMPHTWVGSDFINSIRTMFVYEDELEKALVLGAGLKKEWYDSEKGMSVENLKTYFGDISFKINKSDKKYVISIWGTINLEGNRLMIKNFNEGKLPIKVIADGKENSYFDAQSIVFDALPKEIIIEY